MIRRRRHPIRGLFAGVTLSLGIALLLLSYGAVRSTSITPFVLLVVAGMILGVGLGTLSLRGRAR